MTWYDGIPELTIKLALAVVLAGMVGIERERRGRAAGLRTHVLVCLGSTLAIAGAEFLALEWDANNRGGHLDTIRIAQGIVTGVGFLGAGTIMTVGNIRLGLTTAATIWFVATLGIVIGAGYYLGAVVATAFAFGSITCLRYLESRQHTERLVHLTIRFAPGAHELNEVESALTNMGYEIVSSRIKAVRGEKKSEMGFDLLARQKPDLEWLIQQLEDRFVHIDRIICQR